MCRLSAEKNSDAQIWWRLWDILNIYEHITSLAEDEKITSNYKKHRCVVV